MKPDWKDAPEWAQWLAMDMNRAWYWYENEPRSYESTWIGWESGGRMLIAEPPDNTWRETLEQRPPQDKPL